MASAATKTGFLPKAKAMANNAIFRKALRATRIVVLGVGAYKIGQYNGMRVITEDPDGFERNRFIKALAAEAKRGNSTKYRVLYEREKVDPTYLHDLDMIEVESEHSYDIDSSKANNKKACPLTGAERVSLVEEDINHPELSKYIEDGSEEFSNAMLKVHRVGSRVLDTARIMLEDELAHIAEAQANGEVEELFHAGQAISILSSGDTYGRRTDGPFAGCTLTNLKNAQRLLGLTWEIVLLDSSSANAKQVYEQPRRLFVHAPLINDVCKTEAELAMVLGNVVSHAIFEHEHEQQSIKQALMGTQVVILSMIDPTGVFTAFLEAALLATAMSEVVESMMSAPQDIEADRVALNIVTDAGYDPREAISLYQRLRRAEDLKKEPGNQLQDAGVCPPDINLRQGMLAPALFTIERMRTIEARVQQMSELFDSRKPGPETYSQFAARWYQHIMWRVNAGDEPGGSGAFKKPRQAKVLSRRIVVEENEHIAEPVPGVIDAVGYVAALPVTYLLAPAYNWLIYPVYATISATVADAVAGGGPLEGQYSTAANSSSDGTEANVVEREGFPGGDTVASAAEGEAAAVAV